MPRASDAQKAERLNHARLLLLQHTHLPAAVADRASAHWTFQLAAVSLKKPVPVSDPKIAFTVKISRTLIQQLRTYAASTGVTLSDPRCRKAVRARLTRPMAQLRGRIRSRGNSLDISERQKILRLVVKEVLVGSETITIRHSIPHPRSPGESESTSHTADDLPHPAPAHVTFCVQAVISPLLSNLYLNEVDQDAGTGESSDPARAVDGIRIREIRR